MKYSTAEISDLNHQTKALLNGKQITNALDLEDLRSIIRFHEWQYYVQDNPLISDYEYDVLYKILEKIEIQHPAWITPDSPTQRVSSDLVDQFQSVEHLSPMLSLENSYNSQDLNEFDNRVKKLCGLVLESAVSYFAEPKFDGGSIALIYENDFLIRAATRGDGARGEDITQNARTIRSVPLKAEFSKFGIQKIELRGEAVISKSMFHKINEARETEGLALLANPRNAATGVLRVKDAAETSNRGLDVFIFQVSFVLGKDGENAMMNQKNHSDWMKILDSLGFKVALHERKICNNIDEVLKYINHWVEKRDAYTYDIDGVVVKVNDLKLQEKCDYTSHHPRWAVAFKFQAKQASSTLINVEFQIGKIGSITPVAKIEPVQLAGVIVSSVSLHNEDFIKARDIRYGDQVLVERAGDVIPYIVKSFTELRTGNEMPIEFPSNCPACKTKLIREEDESAWRCPNFLCEAQVVQRLIHHVSKDAMDIDGFGKSLVERFYELGWLHTMADIYKLDFEAIAQLDGLGKKSAEKLQQSIEKAKHNPIHRLLHGLCIHHLGKKVSKLIAEHLDYLPDLANWTLENYTSIKDVGPVVGQNIIAFFSQPNNVAMIQEMETLGINMKQTDEDRPRMVSENAALSGKSILFTGTLKQLDRKEAQGIAEKAGARILSAVSSNLNILVVGEDAGSKLTKARALGTVEIWTEEDFLQKIG
ncbi:MAG: NAD-dependent DNA ligase LigA [Saprospiraceae bacterium]|nr:NAD-dependent DNA ligase LigA [Saprospiraceae bacterium]MBK9222561.1 NAD-dependent DNA ligase LigA [Saprospiraceae bacterium]MBK9720406.1 NAD-dependent DNA ligase LigA [Saprospiraceae bacterium]